jgi:hypothetical protein
MKFDEAQKIFKYFQEYVEISDKLSKIFYKIPESFLPYPLPVLEEAINVLAKNYFDAGDYEKSKTIQSAINFLLFYSKDEEAIESMKQNLTIMSQNPELKKTYLENLKSSRDSWAKSKN